MDMLLLWVARIAGVVGVALYVTAFATRASGLHWVGGMQAGTLLNLGAATMVLGCLCYLARLVETQGRTR